MTGNRSCISWQVSRTNQDYVRYVSKLAALSLPVAQVLINRGIKTPAQIDAYLDPSFGKLHDPLTLPNLPRVVDRIKAASKASQRIVIHGDYDADGVTATAVMLEALGMIGIEASYFIPTRQQGYGFGIAGLQYAKQVGAGLVLTVDCGMTAFDTVSAARAAGIDVIITDHHEPVRSGDGSMLIPDAYAVVNPKLMDETAHIYSLSGAGVAFEVATALLGSNPDLAKSLLDLVAIGTAADVVPLLGDNRIMVREGFSLLCRGERIGTRALLEAAGLHSENMRTSSLPYTIVPRLNAAGRIAEACNVVRLLTTRCEDEAARLATWCNGLNVMRQAIEARVFQEAMAIMERTEDGSGPIVIGQEGWHHGVLGIVAARLSETFNRPALVFTFKDGVAKGSARGIPAFDIHDGLAACKSLLLTFGGHKQAAGVSLLVERLDEFRAALKDVMLERLRPEELQPVLKLDAELPLSAVSQRLVEELSSLEPFGNGNEEPLFGCRRLEIQQAHIVANKHLKMTLRQQGLGIDSIGFEMGNLLETISAEATVDVAFMPVINEWQGGRSLQLHVKALRPSA